MGCVLILTLFLPRIIFYIKEEHFQIKNNKNNEKKCLSEPRFELGISDLFIWADSAHTR